MATTVWTSEQLRVQRSLIIRQYLPWVFQWQCLHDEESDGEFFL